MKRPAFQFYPKDWGDDPGLKLCSLLARGLWIEMLCIMHSADQYGYLRAAGRVLDVNDLSQMVRAPVKDVTRCLEELRRNNVFSETGEGVIFSRRMVRDEELREMRAAGGEGGKEFGEMGAKHGAKGGRPKMQRGVIKPPSDPPPAFAVAFASATASKNQEPKPTAAFAAPDWIPPDLWETYLKTRKKKRASNEPETLVYVVRQLEEFRAQGHNAESILRSSVTSGWAGVFEPKGGPAINGKTPVESPFDRAAREKMQRDMPAIAAKPPRDAEPFTVEMEARRAIA